MSEERLKSLEGLVTEMRVEYAADKAATAAAIDHLTDAVKTLTSTVQDFRDTLNKGKGAVWLFGLVATGIGGGVSWVMTRIFPA